MGDWKRVFLALYEEYLRGFLKDYVAGTENSYDDAAFEFVDKFLTDFLKPDEPAA
jgi:hypothetical protein